MKKIELFVIVVGVVYIISVGYNLFTYIRATGFNF
jgi:hypothetical protein